LGEERLTDLMAEGDAWSEDTYASLALKAGVDITTLAAALGHDVQRLMAIYSHHLPPAEDGAATAMEKALA
jgi:hypothetical protein